MKNNKNRRSRPSTLVMCFIEEPKGVEAQIEGND